MHSRVILRKPPLTSSEFQEAMHFTEYIRVIKGCKQFKAAFFQYSNNYSQLFSMFTIILSYVPESV